MNIAHLFIIALAGSLEATRISEQHFMLARGDRLCLDVDNFLPASTPFDQLNFAGSAEPHIEQTRFPPQPLAEDGAPLLEQLGAARDLKGFRNQLVGILEDEQSTALLTLTFSNKLEAPTPAVHQISSEESDHRVCRDAAATRTHLYALCFSTTERLLQLFSKTQGEKVGQFRDYAFDIKPEDDLSAEAFRLDILDSDSALLLAIHFVGSDNPALQNQFYLTDFVTTGLLTFEAGTVIRRISVVSYNQNTRDALVLAHVDTARGSELRHIKIQDFKFGDAAASQMISENIDDFYYANGLVFTFTMGREEARMDVQLITIHDLSVKNFASPGKKAIENVQHNELYLLIRAVDSEDKPSLMVFDMINQRFTNEELPPGLDAAAIVADQDDAWLVRVGERRGLATRLKRFKYICLDTAGFGSERETLEIKSKEKLLYSFDIELVAKDRVVNNFKVARSIDSLNANKQEYYYLNIRGNNLNLESDRLILYFNKLTPAGNLAAGCASRLSALHKGTFVRLCVDGKIDVYPRLDIEFESLTLSFSHSFSIESGIAAADAFVNAIVFGNFYVVMTRRLQLHYIRLRDLAHPVLKTSDVLTTFSTCAIDGNYFICKQEDPFLLFFVSISQNKDDLVFQVEVQIRIPDVVFNTISVSKFREKKIFYFVKRGDGAALEFHERELDSLFNVKNSFISVNLDEKSSVFQIYDAEFVVFTEEEKLLRVRGLINGSLVDYDLDESYYDKLIDFAFCAEAKVFAFLYRTTLGEYRLFVGRSTLNATERVVRNVLIGQLSDSVALQIDLRTNHQVLFYIYDREDAAVSLYYVFFLYGPIYQLTRASGINYIAFSYNGVAVSESVRDDDFARNRAVALEMKQLEIKHKADKEVEVDLEDQGLVRVSGEVYSLRNEGDGEASYSVLQRVEPEQQWTLLSEAAMNPHAAIALSAGPQGFSLFYQDSLFTKDQSKNNFDFKNCRKIDSDADDPLFDDVFSCSDKNNNSLVITNFGAVAIELGERDVDFTKAVLVKRDSEVYFAASFSGHQSVLFWKIFYNKASGESSIEMNKIFYYNEFLADTDFVKYFHMFVSEGRLILVMVSNNSRVLKLRSLDRENNIIDIKAYSVDFLPAGNLIYNVECRADEVIECVVHSDDYLFDLQINPKTYAHSLRGRYLFTQQFVSFRRVFFSFTERFLFVLTRNFKQTSVLVFKRHPAAGSEAVGVVYSAIALPEGKKISRIAAVDDAAVRKTRVFLAVFEKEPGEETFRHLRVHSFLVSALRIRIDTSAFGYKKLIRLEAYDAKGHLVSGFLPVVYNPNFKIFLMVMVLIALLLLFFVLLVVAVSLKKKNNKLQAELDAKMHDTSYFMDRTQFQV